jgi:hypothetical protein
VNGTNDTTRPDKYQIACRDGFLYEVDVGLQFTMYKDSQAIVIDAERRLER